MTPASQQAAADLNLLAGYLALDDFAGRVPARNDLLAVRAIVLLGNQVVATLVRACSLAQLAPHATLLFSGGAGHSTHLLYRNLVSSAVAAGGALSAEMAEADMYAAVARIAFGIPASRVLVESRSANGGENARFSIGALQAAGLSQAAVLLLQDPTMQRRSVLTWQRQAELSGVRTRVLSHPTLVPCLEAAPDGLRIRADQAEASWTLERLADLLLGEIRRLRDDENGYGPRGRNYFAHVDIPEAVLESYERLISSDAVRSLEGMADFQR